MPAWETFVEHRRYMSWLAIACGAVAAVCVVGNFWVDLRTPATVFTLLCTHATSARVFLAKIIQLQAALDMKRIVIRHDALAAQNFQIVPGDTTELHARDGSRFRLTVGNSCTLHVEYLG